MDVFLSTEKKLNFKKKIASHLKELRKNNQITVNELSTFIKIEKNALNEYESGRIAPSIPKLITLCQHFGISIDFFVLWNKTKYPKNIKLLSLSEKIDKLNQVKRFQIESTAYSLLGNNKTRNKMSNEDYLREVNLSSNFHNNLNKLRKNKKYTQQEIANQLNITNVQVSFYEKKDFPRIDKIVKLSEIFDVSMHALLTGESLCFKFNNNDLKKAMLLVDNWLPLKDQQFLIHLMQRIIEDAEQ